MPNKSVFISENSRDWAHELDDAMERWRMHNDIKMSVSEIRYMSPEEFKDYARTLTRPALIDLRTELDALNAALKAQFASRYKKGKKPNAWVRDAQKVQKIMGTYSMAVQGALSMSSPYNTYSVRFNATFVQVARERLPEEILALIEGETLKMAGPRELAPPRKRVPCPKCGGTDPECNVCSFVDPRDPSPHEWDGTVTEKVARLYAHGKIGQEDKE